MSASARSAGDGAMSSWQPTLPMERSKSWRSPTLIQHALKLGAAALKLPDNKCYTDIGKAFSRRTPPTSAPSSCPPNHHEAVIDVALAHGVDVLCEKPIADTMGASVRIAQKVKAAGRKMAVTMSHRFDQDKTTLRTIVRSGRLGRVNAVSCRYFSDMRKHMAWGALFRHTMDDPLIIEGAVHHLDLRRRSRRREVQDALCLHVEAGLG